MQAITYIATCALTLIIPAMTEDLVPAIVPRAPAITPTTPIVLGTAYGGALDPLATRPPKVGPAGAKIALAGSGNLTIKVVNSIGEPLSISYAANAGAPSPIGNPGFGTLTSSTQLVLPSGWAGRITIGKNYDPKGSKIEASFVAPNYVPDVDVSYVDGYSVPISCSCSGVAVTGCNVSLFHDGHTCANQGPGPICYNPEEDVPNGPASAFFASCQGAAYTFPYDDGANSYGQCGSGIIDCCVGPQCPGPARQPQQLGKRALGDVAKRFYTWLG